MDYRLELIPLPVTDVERAKDFYASRLGFTVDLDFSPNEAFRVVQLTPPGSGCSIAIGVGVVHTAPGSVQGLHLATTSGPPGPSWSPGESRWPRSTT